MPAAASAKVPGPPAASGGRQRGRRAGQPGTSTSLEERLDKLIAQLSAMQEQNAAMMQELGQLRQENVMLRRRLQSLDSRIGGVDAALVPEADVGAEASPASTEGHRGPLPPREEMRAEAAAERSATPPGRASAAEMVTDSPAKIVEPEAKRSPAPPKHYMDDDE